MDHSVTQLLLNQPVASGRLEIIVGLGLGLEVGRVGT